MAGMAPAKVQKCPVRPKTGSEPVVDIIVEDPVVSALLQHIREIREYDMQHASSKDGVWQRDAGPGN